MSWIKKHAFEIGLLLILFVGIAMILFYGNRKSGFHEDEYYTFYSTNRTAGLFLPDREWVDHDSYYNEFVVAPGEGFRYGLVREVQSWDVHPPLYYWLIHTVSSLLPGVFSKWIGIGVNLVAYIICYLLYVWICMRVTARHKILTLIITAFVFTNPVIISGVMFIRMYEWLTVFVLQNVCLHMLLLQEDLGRKKKGLIYLGIALTTYLGFLTQYYYLIFAFFMGAACVMWWLFFKSEDTIAKRMQDTLCYAGVQAVGLGGAILTYPASMSHIFRGYRGTEAVGEFADASNTLGRLRFFVGLVNEYLFDNLLGCFIAVAIVLAVLVAVKKKPYDKNEKEWILWFAVIGYFLTIAKTALILGETSNRYELPVYGLFVMLLVSLIYKQLSALLEGTGKKAAYALGTLLFAALFCMNIQELADGKVIFLYEEEKDYVEYARSKSDTPVVVMYNDGNPMNVWWCTNEWMEYPKLYLASESTDAPFEDEEIVNAKSLLVYMADYEESEARLQMILDSCPNLSSYHPLHSKSLWTEYEFE